MNTLLGVDQSAKRNEHTIRMSSGSAAVNLYRNHENQGLANQMKFEFNKFQQ